MNLERKDDDQVYIEGSAKLEMSDIMGTNGVIHLIDSVLIPDSGMYMPINSNTYIPINSNTFDEY